LRPRATRSIRAAQINFGADNLTEHRTEIKSSQRRPAQTGSFAD
jgi:hypothetical protein